METLAVICTSSASNPSSLKKPLNFATPPLRNDMSGLETAMLIFCACAEGIRIQEKISAMTITTRMLSNFILSLILRSSFSSNRELSSEQQRHRLLQSMHQPHGVLDID